MKKPRGMPEKEIAEAGERVVYETPDKQSITIEDEERILAYVERNNSFSLVKTCDALGLSYFAVIERLKEGGRLFEDLSKHYQKIKYKLIEDVHTAMLKGERTLPSVAHLKFMIDMIDSGTLLGGLASKVIDEKDVEDGDDYSV